MTRERPIIMGAESVRAILAGTKSQTRRLVKGTALEWLAPEMFAPAFVADPNNHLGPYGLPGDRLWVREAWAKSQCETHIALSGCDCRTHTIYRADYSTDAQRCPGWRPSIHMPRWASRLTLEITEVRVQRLQEISEADAQAEGCPIRSYTDGRGVEDRRTAFRDLWDQINGKRAPWSENPWVWCLSFRRIA